jgi:hypothetical protein
MRKTLHFVLGVVFAFVALGALPAGFLMILKPDGSALGITTDMLGTSPFANYLIPGLFLFIVNGLVNLLASVLSFKQHALAGWLGIALGSALVIWIIIQMLSITMSSFMQPMFLIIGIAEIVMGIIITRTNRQAAFK